MPVPGLVYPVILRSHPFRKEREKDGARSNADGDVRVTAGREAGATSVSAAGYCFLSTAVPFSSERMADSSLRKSAARSAGISTWRTTYTIS